jgi:hypothetical protein
MTDDISRTEPITEVPPREIKKKWYKYTSTVF